MGSNWSSLEKENSPDPWWPAPQQSSDTCTTDQDVQQKEVAETTQEVNEERQSTGKVRQEELDIFKEDLARKRALRHEALAALQAELLDLRSRAGQTEELQQELEQQREENRKLVHEKEKLMEQVEQKAALEKQIQALKDVSAIGKEMLRIRELQVKELKQKLIEINISSVTAPPEDLRIEYEKQIENIRKLRTLYEERAAATSLEHRRQLEREEARITVLETKLSELQKEIDDCRDAKKDLEGKIEKLESTIQAKEDELVSTKDTLFSSTIQNKSLNSQIKLINNLFSQMLVSPHLDLDRLIRLLKDNHGLITDLTDKGDSNEVAALLVDLAGQVEQENGEEERSKPTSSSVTTVKSIEQINKHVDGSDNSQSVIASNLSKVWKVMIELLSHHQSSNQIEAAGGAESCYKSVQTPSGPRSVISVSQTFLTLKDLILEKNRLVKEVGRLKTLNIHLEHRLGSQEKRLLVVTTELRKTWGVVNKLKAQHKQLHTHEKILRYELQQKRCMLNELKQELDHCRDKWDQARQKNSQTEEDWKKLRKEFAARKSRKESNSAESGYEEEDIAQSPPSEPVSSGENSFVIRQNEGSETELSEEEIENSDGNSFDTVIDLLDIACIENHTDNETEVPFALREAPPDTSELSPSLLPLSGSEFTEGLDQIESEDLAAVLDIQYQNQLLGADYNLSLPSSSGSSPIPTEHDDFASSEIDVSEEDSSLNDNHIYATPLPATDQTVSEDKLLFGSNSGKNISKFLEGLFIEPENNGNKLHTQQTLHLNVPSTSQSDENDSTTPIVNNECCYQFPAINTHTQAENVNPSEILNQEEICKNEVIGQTICVEQQSISESKPSSSEIRTIKSQCLITSSTQNSLPENSTITVEDSLRAREERLKKLEKQCRSLVSKVMSTSFRSEVLSNKLDELHLCYGSSEEVPDVKEETANLKDINILFLNNDGVKPSNHSCNETSASSSVSNLIDKQSEVPHEAPVMSEVENVSNKLFPQKETNSEETLEVRAARLKRLEDQCKSLFSKMSASSSQSQLISNKVDEQQSFNMSPKSTVLQQPSISKIDTTPGDIRLDHSEVFELKNKIKDHTERVAKEKNNPSAVSDLIDLDSESKAILRKYARAGPSSETATESSSDTRKDRTPEQILEARAERFKRLEDQCKSLVSKMTATSLRSEIITNKLDELHSCYGSSESPSGNDEHSSTSTEGKVRSSPSSSPRHNRRMGCSLEKEKSKEGPSVMASSPMSGESIERVNLTQTVQLEKAVNPTSHNTDRSSRTPEEILQARAQRLNRLEEQCKSLFSKMSATSQRSDVISNRLEELHEQYGKPSTSENSALDNTASTSVATVNTTESKTIPDRYLSHTHASETDQVVISSDASIDLENEGTE